MSEPFVFDPRCTLCKYPFGAVPLGAPVTLHVRPEGREGFVRCALLLRAEFAGEEREWELQAEGWDGERQRFSLTSPRQVRRSSAGTPSASPGRTAASGIWMPPAGPTSPSTAGR